MALNGDKRHLVGKETDEVQFHCSVHGGSLRAVKKGAAISARWLRHLQAGRRSELCFAAAKALEQIPLVPGIPGRSHSGDLNHE